MTHEPPSPYAAPPSSEPRLSVINLVLGGMAFALAAALAGAALRLAGTQTLAGILASVVTAFAFLILWNLRIHRQPHGLFLCLSLLCLAGSAVALGHALYVGDLLLVQTKLGTRTEVRPAPKDEPRVVWEQPRSELPAARSEPQTASTATRAAVAEAPAAPEKPKSAEWTAAWRSAQAEAMSRYPMLGVKNSRENKAFVSTYETLRKANPGYFDDPEWPLRLTEALAERDGWERGDGIIEERPTAPAPASPDTPDSDFEDRSESSLPASPLRPY